MWQTLNCDRLCAGNCDVVEQIVAPLLILGSLSKDLRLFANGCVCVRGGGKEKSNKICSKYHKMHVLARFKSNKMLNCDAHICHAQKNALLF